MAGPVTRFVVDELWRVLDEVDPVDVLCATHRANGQITAFQGDEVLYHDDKTGAQCVFPAEPLKALRVAALAVLAGRVMLAPGPVTATVIGDGLTAELSVSVIARYLPDVVHLSVHNGQLSPRVKDQLDLDGIDVAVTTDISDAVFGASFILATSALAAWLPRRLARGAVVVNTSGTDVPTHVDQVLGEADLARVAAGEHPGRRRLDDVVLVEAHKADRLDAELAHHLYEGRRL